MVVVHNLLKEIVDVNLRSAVDNGLNLVEQLVEFNALGVGDVVKSHLAVNALDYLHLQDGLLGHRPYAQFLGAFNLVFLAILLYQGHEFLAVAARLTGAYALDVLQVVERYGVNRSHLLQRYVLEDDIGRQSGTLADLLAQVFQHGVERRVESRAHAFVAVFLLVFVELVVKYNHERLGIFHELLARRGKFQYAVVLYVLLQISCDKGLTDDGVPQLRVHILARTELFKLVVLVGYDVIGVLAFYEINHIIRAEVFL